MKSPNVMMWCIALICLMNYVISDPSLTVSTDTLHNGNVTLSLTGWSTQCSTVSDISSYDDEILVSCHVDMGSVVNG